MKVKICVGTTCHLMGSSTLVEAFENFEKDIQEKVFLEYSTCFGACQGNFSPPVVKINNDFFENLTPEKFRNTIIEELKKGE